MTEEHLRELLGKCSSRGRSGHRFPQSLLAPYIPGLFAEILRSVAASSHLQPRARKPVVHRPKPTALALPRPVPKPACLEQFVPEIRIPMPSYRPVFNGASHSLPTSSINIRRPPLAEIHPNNLLRNSIAPPPPPKSIDNNTEDNDDILSISSTASRLTIKIPMKRIYENDPEWFEGLRSRKNRDTR